MGSERSILATPMDDGNLITASKRHISNAHARLINRQTHASNTSCSHALNDELSIHSATNKNLLQTVTQKK